MNDSHRIVSSEAEQLILVDADDNETGYLSKAECHDGGGILHRAFSVFLFDPAGRLLLQKRGSGKRLWPGFWSNSCCSHPRRGESMALATSRRLKDELSVAANLEYVYKFAYQADFGAAGAENELCHVYLGRVAAEVQPNRFEIEGIRFVSVDELEREFEERGERFTPWFRMEWRALRGVHAAILAGYTSPGGDQPT